MKKSRWEKIKDKKKTKERIFLGDNGAGSSYKCKVVEKERGNEGKDSMKEKEQ